MLQNKLCKFPLRKSAEAQISMWILSQKCSGGNTRPQSFFQSPTSLYGLYVIIWYKLVYIMGWVYVYVYLHGFHLQSAVVGGPLTRPAGL